MRALLLAALLLAAPAASAGNICIRAEGTRGRGQQAAEALCSADTGFASGFEVKWQDFSEPPMIVVRVDVLPDRVTWLRSDANARKIGSLYAERLPFRDEMTVIIAFIPVRIGGSGAPFVTYSQAPGKAGEVQR